MPSNHHAPYDLGYKRATMVGTTGRQGAVWSKALKAAPIADCGLVLPHMKVELVVIAEQNAAVNAFPGLGHTARHTMEVWGDPSR